MQEGLEYLDRLLDKYDWFDEAYIEGQRYIVYVFQMGEDVDKNIPDQIMSHQVLVHFSCAKNISADQYILSSSKVGTSTLEYLVKEISLFSDLLMPDLSDLCKELDRLEKLCGQNVLGEIFFECHDGINAVTNLSQKYPEVRKKMEKLYSEYGFDLIYNELEL